jgi:DhnA family fructose-bisphosphate aldolase class Ia
MSALRERRLFRESGRSLVIAMDHARVMPTVTGLKDINSVIKTCIGAGADAILAPMGSAAGCASALGNGGLWLSVDTTAATASSVVESALRLGADGIKAEIYPWCKPENDFFRNRSGAETVLGIACLVAECHKWGLPCMIESIPHGWPAADKRTPETVAAAARVASETGADYVKTFYTGDKESFTTAIENCNVPILILGGVKVDSDKDVLQMVRDAIDCGAVGITMGRNIWGHDNIAGMTAALAAIVHDDSSVDDAYGLVS